MPYTLINIITDKPIESGDAVRFPYPEGKDPSKYFGASHHTLSFNAIFFKAPRDFTVLILPETIELIWQGRNPIPSQTLVNIQIEEPGGDFFLDPAHGVLIREMVRSQMFMMNMGRPIAPSEDYYVKPRLIQDSATLPLENLEEPAVSRNLAIHAKGDASGCVFKVFGEDMYERRMVEYITGPKSGVAYGQKAFARLVKIVASGTCEGEVSIGVGNALGMPSFLPGSGFVLRQLINAKGVTGGIIIPGSIERPGPTTPDVRGTYTPPSDIQLDGTKAVQLLVSLFNPGNIGMNDYFE